MMRNSITEASHSSRGAIDLISEVKELQRFNSQELSKLLKDCENFSLFHITANGLSVQIDMDKLVRLLPLHLIAVLLSSQRDEASLRYLLSGLRLLCTLCEIASRHSKLEQILFDDLKVSEQLLDLVFHLLLVCCKQELCGKGGVLHLVQSTLKLNISPFLKEPLAVVAAVSRLKARVLSILLHLCEAESVSYLDEVASIPESLDLAKSVAVEVITLLKTMLSRDLKLLENHSGKIYPRGLLQLNALRLADIFSDDSNFRSYITIYFAEVLAAILLIPYQQFLSSWCSSDLPLKEVDASLEYDPFTMAGWILDSSPMLDIVSSKTCESNFNPTNNAQASYAHQRTSLLVKVIANLHCFVPNICKEQERNFFLHKFLERLKMDWQDQQAGFSFSSAPQKAVTICKNLRSLLGHAESLIPTFLNEEDVQLLSGSACCACVSLGGI
ncbi:nodulin homeobox isoform X5 [Beta vulgaris subsp. vulgaris]|uniref:nodulin homeobox isoform X5 n=1 Tax=Beta vulgaris subsp. vulgaris TaxID=3555 RepID=UPI002546ADFD|nr:nodulin homeobox isoform X5 [Beta vulgaris subsp. vulgaris]